MKFIQIKDGVSIGVDHIVSLERLGKNSTQVQTIKSSFSSKLPYDLLINMIERDIAPETKSTEELARAYLEQVGIQVP